MDIKGEDYHVWYEESDTKVSCQGSLRLAGTEEYAPIVHLLEKVIDKNPSKITLDLRQLEFLNSSGINVLSKFVIKVRQNGTIQVLVQGSDRIPWQGKSLKNLQRLMPSLELEWSSME
ncbi:STAS domain-containing protein [Tumidithrix elongata RA019]|uniref:STAS domain-containing protein n=1 Tax=Tumidithrix elongata BACA0141 TaxID=2716417 RepID=A0AAW9Q4S5_9CYAN|nr:STAS domain-containing protein [Tumidithrix elongata RA019]